VAVLVDPAIWPRHGRRFAHLASDTSFEELHAFAAAMGVPPREFHRDHYDVTDELRLAAVEAGAHPITTRELVARLRASGLRRPRRRTATGSR